MQFVSVGNNGQEDQETRKLIRRHVMLGKNRGRTPRRPKQSTLMGATVFKVDGDNQAHVAPQPLIGSNLSSLIFADDVSSTLKDETVRFCTTMTETMHMLEPCIAFDSRSDWSVCIQPLCQDALYANVMVFGSQVYIDKAFHQATSRQRKPKQDLQHYDKSLRLLRERLPSISSQPSTIFDAVILAVYTLAMYALITGDFAVARSHVCGLCSLVSVRPAGIHSFRARGKQMIELLRCDLSISLATGQPPCFSPTTSGGPLVKLSNPTALIEAFSTSEYSMDHELFEIWQVLARFCAKINAVAANHERLSQEVLLDTMASVMYRTLDLSLRPNSIDQAIQLAVLAFCATIFLSWPLLRIPFPWLQNRLDTAIVGLLQLDQQHTIARLALWIIGIRAVAFHPIPLDQKDHAQTRLLQLTEACGLYSWVSKKKVFSSFLWIDVVCDRKAKPFFDGIEDTRPHPGTINW